MAQVKLSQIVKHYDDGTEVIRGIDLDIRDGELIVFVGPSGCGKSTLLRMIAGLESITGGELMIDGQVANDLPPAKRGLAMVFQSYALYPHMSVYQNMAFSLKLSGMKRDEVDRAVRQAADVLQIASLLQRKPKELSGGQRQRVAIGRAIVRKPSLFLFDEPLSNLDASLRVQMRLELSRLHQQLQATMIYVTHDQVEAMTLGERIVVFNGGHIEQIGTPLELYEHPVNLFVAGFLGAPKMNFLAGRVEAKQADGTVLVQLSDGARLELRVQSVTIQVGDPVTIGIRAEHIERVADHDAVNRVQFKTVLVEHLGDSCIAYGRMAAGEGLIAVKQIAQPAQHAQPAPGSVPTLLKSGDTATLALPARHCHLFDSNGRACRRLQSLHNVML